MERPTKFHIHCSRCRRKLKLHWKDDKNPQHMFLFIKPCECENEKQIIKP